jgi:AcrR family transcriptional regulator
MAEASRRLGVVISAPYRHFADRDALLAAVALRAAGLLAEQLDRTASSWTPAQRLAAAAQAYVRFADEQRRLFQALAGAGLNKDSHPEIASAAQTIGAVFLAPSAALASTSPTAAARLGSAIVTTAHGHATLMLDRDLRLWARRGPGCRRTGSRRDASTDHRPGIADPAATDRRPSRPHLHSFAAGIEKLS